MRKMATKRLYYDDAFEREFSAEVLSCKPAEPAALENLGTAARPQNLGSAATLATPANRLWRVKLDRTAFYPTSGGQPHDTGQLAMRA